MVVAKVNKERLRNGFFLLPRLELHLVTSTAAVAVVAKAFLFSKKVYVEVALRN
jgi:hypothetical protein